MPAGTEQFLFWHVILQSISAFNLEESTCAIVSHPNFLAGASCLTTESLRNTILLATKEELLKPNLAL